MDPLATAIGAVLVASGFSLMVLGPQSLRRKGALASDEGRRRLKWIVWVAGVLYIVGLLVLASGAGWVVVGAVVVGLFVLLQVAAVPVYVRDYRRATRRARAQREARARRKAADS